MSEETRRHVNGDLRPVPLGTITDRLRLGQDFGVLPGGHRDLVALTGKSDTFDPKFENCKPGEGCLYKDPK